MIPPSMFRAFPKILVSLTLNFFILTRKQFQRIIFASRRVRSLNFYQSFISTKGVRFPPDWEFLTEQINFNIENGNNSGDWGDNSEDLIDLFKAFYQCQLNNSLKAVEFRSRESFDHNRIREFVLENEVNFRIRLP